VKPSLLALFCFVYTLKYFLIQEYIIDPTSKNN
jgi:hypothetical protein